MPGVTKIVAATAIAAADIRNDFMVVSRACWFIRNYSVPPAGCRLWRRSTGNFRQIVGPRKTKAHPAP